MRNSNTIILVSDEHHRDILGCYGDPLAITPNLDRLAEKGVRFAQAFTNSPICVPARAALATGRYPHQTGYWDSVTPFDGQSRSSAGYLRACGHETVSAGKLHYRSTQDDNGFSREMIPMHIKNGVGFLSCLLRDPPVALSGTGDFFEGMGAGESSYIRFDNQTTDTACAWLEEAAQATHAKPWVMQVGLMAPHYPLIVPDAFYRLYDGVTFPSPRQYTMQERPDHPAIEAYRQASQYDQDFDDETLQKAMRAYYGLCSYLDSKVGQILDTLENTGLIETTRLIYTSDHGENLGHRGLWGKSVMYDDSVAIPMIMSGPDLPEHVVVDTPVSLVDIYPTVIEWAGETLTAEDADLPGETLTARLADPAADRAIFCENHDWGSNTGMFMLRTLNWKIVRYGRDDYPDQLFDMTHDPHERHDLAADPDHANTLEDMRARLSAVLDYRAVNAEVLEAQQAKIAAHGGRDAILAMPDEGYTPAPVA